MMRRIIGAAAVCAMLGSGAPAQAQAAQDLVGSWRLVSITAAGPGRDAGALGENPSGTVMFGSDGRFALIIVRSDLPKLASNSRASATPEENRAIVQGSIAFFGTYSVEDAGKALIMRIENGTFPNWAGAVQRRAMTLNGNELSYTTSGSGDAAATVTLRRAS
ncbi:lipocalin-like domain-containing protein [Belnapia sp. T18]|uniref:Lipocalin-like domain-containing protein n=1 Tax=Belnapia arida TaxID=2804533 RepID=A0ABS1TZ74_9PROT|nr:lipocalin-like domain-containing protein [Belnapia arida]MBL6077731.1 lipocalin-like domain-containing protein [Belnapia arida]